MEEKEEGLFLYVEPEEMTEEERKPKPQIKLIPFSLADEWYALNIEEVLEILKIPSITKVPNLPDFILGVTNIRGNITSVTDLKRLFGLAQTQERPESRIIVIRQAPLEIPLYQQVKQKFLTGQARKTTGLLVDSAGKALSLPLDSLQPALSTIPEIKADYIKGEAKLTDGRLLTILDLEKIMASDQMRFE